MSALIGPWAADLKECTTCMHTVRHAMLQRCHMYYNPLLLCVREWQSCTKLADAAWYEFVGHLHLFARDRCCHSHWVPWHDKPQVIANSVCWWCSLGSAIFRYVGQYLTKTIQATLQLLSAVLAVLRAAEWPVGTSYADLPWHNIYNRLIAQLCVWSTKVWCSYRTQQAAGTQEAGYYNQLSQKLT